MDIIYERYTSLNRVLKRAEGLGGRIEARLGIPQRGYCLVIRKLVTEIIPETETALEEVVAKFEDVIAFYPKVVNVPNSMLNITFSDRPSAVNVVKSDLLVTIPRLFNRGDFVYTVKGNQRDRYATTVYIVPRGDFAPVLEENSSLLTERTQFSCKYVEAQEGSYQLPNSAEKYDLIYIDQSRAALQKLIVRRDVR